MYNKQRLGCKEKNMVKKVACRSNSVPTVFLTSVFLLYHFSDVTLFLLFTCLTHLWWIVGAHWSCWGWSGRPLWGNCWRRLAVMPGQRCN